MGVHQHAEHRAWAFQALDDLKSFLDDPDFEGEAETERAALDRTWRELRDNKYRVVFLGAFNVGKSALINAFLGNEYLPMVVEECTTKITHIFKAETMKTVLRPSTCPSPEEVQALRAVIDACHIGASVTASDDGSEIAITYAGSAPQDLLKSLRPLVTVSADDDFPRLRSLRTKFDELFVHLPTDRLEEDIAFIDSPGVHSILETHQKITQEIIPNSHLVICLIDSQNAGNVHNREFIETVVKQRHRKLFFVINKADQLNDDEIDPLGRRGPAKDLIRSLAGAVEAPEIFFVSALYALVASQLAQYHLMLSDLDHNNRIKIPWGVQRELLESDQPLKGVVAYLTKRSSLVTLRNRLMDYLYHENREGAVLESVCRYVDTTAWQYARPIQVKLDMARDIPRLAELKKLQETLAAELDQNSQVAERVEQTFQGMSTGGEVDGAGYPGYEALVESGLTEAAVRQRVIDPIRGWLFNDENYRTARKGRFVPLAVELESMLDGFLRSVYEDIDQHVRSVENHVRAMMGRAGHKADMRDLRFLEIIRRPIGDLRVSLFKSCVAFGAVTGILGATLGGLAVAGGVLGPQPGQTVLLGMAVGLVAGAGIGVLARGITSRRARRAKLMRSIADKVKPALLSGAKGTGADQVVSVKDQLRDLLDGRRAAFAGSIQAAFETAASDLHGRITAAQAEEDAIRRKQEEIIARLEPKIEKLSAIGRKAHEIAETNAPR